MGGARAALAGCRQQGIEAWQLLVAGPHVDGSELLAEGCHRVIATEHQPRRFGCQGLQLLQDIDLGRPPGAVGGLRVVREAG